MKKQILLFILMLLPMAARAFEDLTPDMMFTWEGWGADAKKVSPFADCSYVLGEATGQPYGDTAVNAFADLSAYTRLVLTLVEGTDGTPRFLFNRTKEEGQWNADESQSYLIDSTQDGWSSKYFSQEGNVYTVDIKQMVKDKGFAHLHAIKAPWGTTVTVESMVLVGLIEQAIEIDGIYYNLIPKAGIAEVTNNPNKYTGSIDIPESFMYDRVTYAVKSIGESAFAGCSGLTSVTIPNSVTAIGSSAFSNCSGLTSMVVEAENTVYDSRNGCNAIIKTANNELIAGCMNTVIPNSVTSIGDGAFWGCSGLTSVTIPNSVISIGYEAFWGCSGLTSVTFGNSVTSIGSSAFSRCSSLTSVIIANSVTSIGSYAFRNCSGLTSITIGKSIKNIYSEAFADCKNLTDVTCMANTVPTTASNAFNNSYIEYATLHVPDASVAAYSNREPWSQFGTKVGLSGGTTQKCATPTISYTNDKLTFSSETEGAEFVYEITATDHGRGNAVEVSLDKTYVISVYATKEAYENSDVAEATLCWIDVEPRTFDPITGVAEVKALPVFVKAANGVITVTGADNGTKVEVYGIDGVLAGKAFSYDGMASVATSLPAGEVAIVKIGEKSIKVTIK